VAYISPGFQDQHELMNYKKEYLYKKIVGTKQFIDRSYRHEISLDVLMNEANISKYHFVRLFKSIYKITPHQYLMSKRIKYAKMELENTDESISSICDKVGFNSIGSFCNLFKKVTAQTPLEYRNAKKKIDVDRKKSPIRHIPGCYALMHHPF